MQKIWRRRSRSMAIDTPIVMQAGSAGGTAHVTRSAARWNTFAASV
jgi:hypothetical protein